MSDDERRTESEEMATETPAKRRRVMDPTYEPPLLVPIAEPLADVKLTKRVLRLINKSTAERKVRRGVKEVVKSIRKEKNAAGKQRLCVLAGDITPLDVISHIPVLCEEHNIPYVFVRSRTVLGQAARTKRPTSVVMVVLDADSEHAKTYEKCVKKIKKLMPSYE